MNEPNAAKPLSAWEKFQQQCNRLSTTSPSQASQADPLEDSLPPWVSQVFGHQTPTAASQVSSSVPLLYHLLLVPAEEPPFREEYQSPHEIGARLAELDGKEVNVFVVYGQFVPISVGPQRVLMMPDDTFVPAFDTRHIGALPPELFVPVTEVEPQEDGYLGPPEFRMPTPTTAPPEEETMGSDQGEEPDEWGDD